MTVVRATFFFSPANCHNTLPITSSLRARPSFLTKDSLTTTAWEPLLSSVDSTR